MRVRGYTRSQMKASSQRDAGSEMEVWARGVTQLQMHEWPRLATQMAAEGA